MRLAGGGRRHRRPHEVALRRIALPAVEVLGLRAHPAVVAEALECLGGNGVEESGLPLLTYREAPEPGGGSGNVNALDVLRARSRGGGPRRDGSPRSARPGGGDARLDRTVDDTLALLGFLSWSLPDRSGHVTAGSRARWAAVLQGSLLVRFAPA